MEIWGLIGSLAGVALGWGLTQASSWLGTRQADRRTRKEVLYFLLELRGLLRRVYCWNQLIPEHVQRLRQHLTPPPAEADMAVNEQLGSWLRAMLLPLIGPQLIALKAGYEAGLLKLAALDPVSAYRLRGLDELLQRVPQVLEVVQTAGAAQLELELPLPAGATDFFRQHLEPASVRQALELVQEVVKELATQLDRPTQASLQAEWDREWERDKQGLDGFDEYMEKLKVAIPSWAA